VHKKPEHTKGRSNHVIAAEGIKEPLPTEVSKEDANGLLYANEKAMRIQAQLQLLAQQHATTQGQLEAARTEAAGVAAELWKKYQLGPEDQFDNNTRQIIRKPAAEPVAAN
jgi:hypothetical protein